MAVGSIFFATAPCGTTQPSVPEGRGSPGAHGRQGEVSAQIGVAKGNHDFVGVGGDRTVRHLDSKYTFGPVCRLTFGLYDAV